MEFARHLLRVFAALLITALASNTTNAGASALYAGQVSEHGSNAADYVQISNAELIEGLSAAITSGGNVNATQIGATVGASGFENNYLTHAEELMRIQAQINCSEGDQASCETFADLQQLDADRDEFLAGCIGNYSDDCRGIRSHLTRTVAEYVEIAQQLDNAGISSDPTAGLPGYGMERKEALFQFSTYADVNDEFDFSDLVSTDMQSSLARSILQGDLSSATITSVNMLAAADVMQLGAEAGSGILIPLPPGAALSASAMLQIEFGMDVLDAFGLGGGFTSVGGGAIRRTTTDAGAANNGLRPTAVNPTSSQIAAAERLGVDPSWVKADGSVDWPTNYGFDGPPTIRELQPGQTFDRYGGRIDENGNFSDRGSFVAPVNVPFDQRSLPDSSLNSPYRQYEVLQPIPQVNSGPAAPWFGRPGGGTQHQLPMSIDELLDKGFIRQIK